MFNVFTIFTLIFLLLVDPGGVETTSCVEVRILSWIRIDTKAEIVQIELVKKKQKKIAQKVAENRQ